MFSIFEVAVIGIILLILILLCIKAPDKAVGYFEYALAILGGTFSLYYFSSYLKYIPLVIVICYVATHVDIQSLNIAQNLSVQQNAHTS